MAIHVERGREREGEMAVALTAATMTVKNCAGDFDAH